MYLPVGVLEEIAKVFKNLQGRARAGVLFIVKLQHVMAYKRLLGQLYQKRGAYTEALIQLLSVILKNIWTRLLIPLLVYL